MNKGSGMFPFCHMYTCAVEMIAIRFEMAAWLANLCLNKFIQ